MISCAEEEIQSNLSIKMCHISDKKEEHGRTVEQI